MDKIPSNTSTVYNKTAGTGHKSPPITTGNAGNISGTASLPPVTPVDTGKVSNVTTVNDVRGKEVKKSNPEVSQVVVQTQSNGAKEVSGEKVEKTRGILQQVKDNIGLVDVKVDDNNIVIDKPWPMKDAKIPLQEGKLQEARSVVSDLTKKFKADQNPTAQDSVRVLNVVDHQKLMAMLEKTG